MEQEEKDAVIRRYAERLNRLGPTVQTLGWRDQEQQQLRFSILLELGFFEGCTVLDVGCGFGDFYTFLTSKGFKVDYTGIDISPEVLGEARQRHPDLRFELVDLLAGDFEGKFDFVVESGIFNHRLADNDGFVRAMLTAMFEHSTHAIAANMMTDFVDYRDDYLHYYDPGEILRFARTLSRFVAVRHDYPLFEFTLFVHRGSRSAA